MNDIEAKSISYQIKVKNIQEKIFSIAVKPKY